MAAVSIAVVVNGRPQRLDVEPQHSLLQVLRDQLGLTGTKECCSAGECGACTVLLNGGAVDSCLILGAEADGSAITTIEGIGSEVALDPVQDAFLETGAVQCGFCIPGMILAAKHLLAQTPHPTEAEIKEGLAGNLCRCAGYSRIVAAVMVAVKAGR